MGRGWFGCCCNKEKFAQCQLCQDELPEQEMRDHRSVIDNLLREKNPLREELTFSLP